MIKEAFLSIPLHTIWIDSISFMIHSNQKHTIFNRMQLLNDFLVAQVVVELLEVIDKLRGIDSHQGHSDGDK